MLVCMHACMYVCQQLNTSVRQEGIHTYIHTYIHTVQELWIKATKGHGDDGKDMLCDEVREELVKLLGCPYEWAQVESAMPIP